MIFEIQMKGYKPVLAHPERYPYFYSKSEIFEELINRGVLFQVNINSLSGHYGIGAVKTAKLLLDKKMVSFLGSDCHHTGHLILMKKVLIESSYVFNNLNFMNESSL
jgi:tyrosine-protein phosphatase YwqE